MEEWKRTASGLSYSDLRPCDGAPVMAGDTITVHYKMSLKVEEIEQGPWLENTWEKKQPITISLGKGQILRGLEEGIMGMKIAGYRRFIIPPVLAFGSFGVPNKVPSDSILICDIYIVNIESRN